MCLNNKGHHMKYLTKTFIASLSTLLVSCGGSDDTEVNNVSTVTTEVDAVTQISQPVEEVEVVEQSTYEEVKPDPDAIYDTTAKLVAAKSFLLEAQYDLEVSFTNQAQRKAYISICSDFSESEAMKVNYNSCIVRTSVTGSYSDTITVGNDNQELVMAIWYFDDINNPRYEVWQNTQNGDNTKVFSVN